MKPIRPERKPRPQTGGQISSGFPSPAEDYEEPPLDLHDLVVENPPATYFMRADTDSMQQAGVQRGDVLVVDRSLDPKPGRLVIAIIEEQFTVKKYVQAGNSMHLADDLDTLEIAPDDIWGVVIYIVHKA